MAKLRAWKQSQERRYHLTTVQEQASRLVQIRQLIGELFSLDEMDTLMFDLGINQEAIRGNTAPEKARELVLYCERRELVDTLVNCCQAARPHAPWPVL